ncbi:HlyD family efflux transporter periplasmic adaptor subunit [Pontibacter sp. G13]|uniref:HlyD family secretion protein n=1 Tax=Pontibacter sp. G13 TaxID=3074898 RepID=UPI00288980D9|nr:HlyD family efflux transporter periplasmic adaptor subunit [Pontibacter sp. G13]WNJ19890.1 efflux RND transporter periplasmic adaptor subunit [Pontibacter sp. G13]
MLLSIHGCQTETAKSDAYGNFEAVEITVSAEGNGQLIDFPVESGQILESDEYLGQIDTILLQLQMAQVEANIASLGDRVVSIHEQIAVYEAKQRKLEQDQARLKKLFAAEAATQQQLDQVENELAINASQLAATRSSIQSSNKATMSQYQPLQKQVDLIKEQIRRCRVIAPGKGTVLQKFVEQGEMVSTGKPLFKMADLSVMKIKAFASANQLANLQVDQTVTVKTDDGQGGFRDWSGVIEWISDEAEFTPKTIQTREERVSLVYAFKVRVNNEDGLLRIGMPGEVIFQTP